jgi:hypothetical protein
MKKVMRKYIQGKLRISTVPEEQVAHDGIAK